MLPGPGDKLARVGAVGPDQRDPLVPVAQAFQRGFGAVAVLDAGGGDDDDRQQAQGAFRLAMGLRSPPLLPEGRSMSLKIRRFVDAGTTAGPNAEQAAI
ncbi:hypothetical protein [Nonomuraea sp. bgisy101]|uniref:hypothetical protein n=1 Tax=Nonomuraea sp. bgisy101 TaxID=3413784 RepID=UPI003D73318B